MSLEVTKFNDYKSFLKADIEFHQNERGYQSTLAHSAKCQQSYLSQVINGDSDLNRDHAANLCAFWDFDSLQTDYYLTLVDLARAGSPQLMAFCEAKLKQIRQAKSSLTERLDRNRLSDTEMQSIYYSSWYWSAIHILVSCPQYGTATAIAKRLEFPVDVIETSLRKLQQMGLTNFSGGKWKVTQKDIHLPDSSVLNEVNHANWRNRAIVDIQKKHTQSLHYSSVFAVSVEDAKKMREILLETTLKIRKLIPPSPEQEAYSFNLDFFKV